MRYNFVPALNPMAPCFCKGVAHVSLNDKCGVPYYFSPRYEVIESKIVGSSDRCRSGIFVKNVGMGAAAILPDGREWYHKRWPLGVTMTRKPTAYHKYQYRPARRYLNLRHTPRYLFF